MTALRLLPAAARTPRPWKNGGGVTTEVAASPEGAGIDSFDWRISIAEVACDGPFSVFPGVDRVTAILSGAGLVLDVEGSPPVTLTAGGEPHSYPGDRPTFGRLVAGPVTDLNLMVRRGRLARVRRVPLETETSFEAGPAVLLWLSGAGTALTSAGEVRLGPLDAALSENRARWTLRPDRPGIAFMLEF